MLLEFLLFCSFSLAVYIWSRGIEHVVVHQRWLFVCLFLMPLSVIVENWLKLRNWIVFQLCSAPLYHDDRVAAIQEEVRKWKNEGAQIKLCTARPGWQTVSLRIGRYKETHKKININLMDILKIDEEKQTVRAEPLVTMGQLSNALIPLGWTVPVVPELDVLTVGGLVMGVGIETSSHKYGLFQHICVSYDVILSSGELIHCSKDENSDLFYQIPWSHGTLGFLVATELKIIPSKQYVQVEYAPIHGLDEISVRLSQAVADVRNDFVECLMYSIDTAVLMTGKMTNECNVDQINEIGNYYKPWFFEHVREFLTQSQDGIEYIPLRHYYHRHTRSLFWELQDIVPFGNNPFFRYLLGWAMPPQISLLKITSPQIILDLYENKHVVQDMLVPLTQLKDALHCFHKHLQVYPLWICPFKLLNIPGIVRPATDEQTMYVDIGAYGTPKVTSFQGPETIRKIEQFVLEKKGFQMLYADSYLTREDFRKMFNHVTYDQLRVKYNAEIAFPTIYEKVCRSARR